MVEQGCNPKRKIQGCMKSILIEDIDIHKPKNESLFVIFDRMKEIK